MPNAIGQSFSSEIETRIQKGEIPKQKLDAYTRLTKRIEKELLPHPVITNNTFTAWFEKGEFDREDCKHFLVQFSVFSNLFIEAQLKKVINAPTLEAMHQSKEILMNELGVIFRNPKKPNRTATFQSAVSDDEDLVEAEGTVEGGNFRFGAAHFEWLLRMARYLDLDFNDVGKRKHGTPDTLFFCDELSRLYGSADPVVGLAASFAVENWAAAGFWKQLIKGLEVFRDRECPKLPIGFFKWHDMIEDQHAQHTWDELQEDYFDQGEIDDDKFIAAGREMLAGVHAFWKGLDSDRKSREKVRRIRH